MESRCSATQAKPFCQIRGRMISENDLHRKIANLCNFNDIKFDESLFARIDATADLSDQLSTIDDLHNLDIRKNGDAILILEAQVPYQSSWGGFGPLPNSVRNLRRQTPLQRTTPAGFIEPYLCEYKQACRAVRLAWDGGTSFSIAIPDYLLSGDNGSGHHSLLLQLDPIVDRDQDNNFTTIKTNGSCKTYPLSKAGVKKITDSGFSWVENRLVSIGSHLSTDLLLFREIKSSCCDNLLARLLLPEMATIVTDGAPQLRAAEILLQHQFSELIAELDNMSEDLAGRVYCIAGLNIDMRGQDQSRGGYFIPWKAYRNDHTADHEADLFEQDDFFSELMGQDQKSVSDTGPPEDS